MGKDPTYSFSSLQCFFLPDRAQQEVLFKSWNSQKLDNKLAQQRICKQYVKIIHTHRSIDSSLCVRCMTLRLTFCSKCCNANAVAVTYVMPGTHGPTGSAVPHLWKGQPQQAREVWDMTRASKTFEKIIENRCTPIRICERGMTDGENKHVWHRCGTCLF